MVAEVHPRPAVRLDRGEVEAHEVFEAAEVLHRNIVELLGGLGPTLDLDAIVEARLDGPPVFIEVHVSPIGLEPAGGPAVRGAAA
jgi:hypothetical protein